MYREYVDIVLYLLLVVSVAFASGHCLADWYMLAKDRQEDGFVWKALMTRRDVGIIALIWMTVGMITFATYLGNCFGGVSCCFYGCS